MVKMNEIKNLEEIGMDIIMLKRSNKNGENKE